MFSIANEIAYDGQMVQANRAPDTDTFPLGPSCWIDISSLRTPGHVNEEEMDFVRGVRAWIGNQPEDAQRSVFFISPFKKVALACGEDTVSVKSGSVHAFQGKEADIVFIVLGSSSGAQGAGSRKWAGAAPNILNVALTRAKKRVYVVGSISDWEDVPNFDVLARHMRETGQIISDDEALARLKRSAAVTAPETVPEPAWRTIGEIWEEHARDVGFRVVRSTWKGNDLAQEKAQYGHVCFVSEAEHGALEVKSSFTKVASGLETRKPARPLKDYDKPEWVTLDEWRAWAATF